MASKWPDKNSNIIYSDGNLSHYKRFDQKTLRQSIRGNMMKLMHHPVTMKVVIRIVPVAGERRRQSILMTNGTTLRSTEKLGVQMREMPKNKHYGKRNMEKRNRHYNRS